MLTLGLCLPTGQMRRSGTPAWGRVVAMGVRGGCPVPSRDALTMSDSKFCGQRDAQESAFRRTVHRLLSVPREPHKAKAESKGAAPGETKTAPKRTVKERAHRDEG
jgi:hypothetical protein